jgi:hypothetical protein
VEEMLGHSIYYSTFRHHLERLVKENILQIRETAGRDTTSNIYSLTTQAKKQKDFRIIRTDPVNSLFKKIYIKLFFCAISESEIHYCCDNSYFDRILSLLLIKKDDLKIINIKKQRAEKKEFGIPDVVEPMPVRLAIYYQPISGAYISELVNYYEDLVVPNHFTESDSHYEFLVHGISIKEFTEKFDFDLKSVKEAFESLLKYYIIRKIPDIGGEFRYTLTNWEFSELIEEIKSLEGLKHEINNIRLDYLGGEIDLEEVRRSLDTYKNSDFFSKSLTNKELQRKEWRDSNKQKMNIF